MLQSWIEVCDPLLWLILIWVLFQHTSWSFLSALFLCELGPCWSGLRVTAPPLPLQVGTQLFCAAALQREQFASLRTCGIVQQELVHGLGKL